MININNNNTNKFLGDYDRILFWSSLSFILLIVGFGIAYPETLNIYAKNAQNFLGERFGWAFILSLTIYVGVGLWLGLSRFGTLKLGKDDDVPEFSTFTWISMLFSCGIGVGFLLWGVAEPLYSYMQTPYLAEPGSPEAIEVAMQISSMHWGLHSWMGYCLVGLCIAFPAFRYDKPMTIGIALHGLLNGRTENSILSRALDFIGAIATIGGTATVLGLGVISIDYGINHIFKINTGTSGKVIIISILAILYTLSAVSGLKKGVAVLSTLNVIIVIFFCLFILLAGDTNTLLRYFTTNLGNYASNIIAMSFWSDPHHNNSWLTSWTVFFWLIVISWSPFVGGFVARISRGRSIKEFIIYAVIIPTICSMLWFVVIGGTSINIEQAGKAEIFKSAQENIGSGIYIMLETFPMSNILNIVVFSSMIIFIITSAVSACFFIAMLMSRGMYEPRFAMKSLWGAIIGALAIVLLLSGGLSAVRTASIVAGSPFTVAIGLMIYSLSISLRKEYGNQKAYLTTNNT